MGTDLNELKTVDDIFLDDSDLSQRKAQLLTSVFIIWFITDSHDTSGALCVREADFAGWDLQGRVYTQWSLN